ncbi:MAG TPA: amino acid adenylation domain-containing protein, partial [Thermoanaerobaculia bacterium]|nr:amino acid adenylation domain-containing protein [Thermoanaerobaculia bacterium]
VLPPHDAKIVFLGEEEEGGDLAVPAPGSLAYRIYTSGTTGKPKAVEVEHGMLAATLAATREKFGFTAGDRMACLAAPTFDIFFFELLSPLLSGGTAVFFPQTPKLDVEQVAGHLSELTHLHAVPALMRSLLDALPENGKLRQIFTGGDAVPADLLEDLRQTFPAAQVWVLYGPTEATILCSAHPVPPESARPLLGRPLPGAVLHVCDAAGEILPIGVPGELWIGGPGVTRGYLGREELTAEKFVRRGGERFYRSGDRVRRLADGTLEFLGRLDHQVKIRGFRIELGEIEEALSELEAVREAVVVAREDRPGNRRLVAYVVGDTAVEELRQFLRDRLPEYMVPAAFVILEALPLTVHGKVDRKALPAPEQPVSGSLLAPRTPVEARLAGIWAEVLGLEKVGADDHFFELGGHSLLATQVMSRLRGAFGVELPLRDLFMAPRLSDLAARIEGAGAQPLAPPLVPVSREGDLPLSFAQQRLWFIDQLEPGSPLYNMPVALRVEGPLDAAVLAQSLGEIVQRHEALRTVFAAPQGTPVQVIRPAEPFELPVVDLSGRPDAEALALAREEAARPFDLARGPLLRGLLLRLGETDHVVVLTVHHIASDGWSMGILVREVAALYGGSPLPPLPVQYADFAAWQRSWLQGPVLEQEIAFWRNQLAGLPPVLELPTDRPRPAAQSYRGAVRPVRLAQSLEALARQEGATLFMVLLAGFQALLGRWSGQDDLAVGSPVAGRNRVETEGLIGFFVNTLVLRGDLSGTPTFRELLGRVRETALAAYLHQDVPFEKLVEELAPERSLAHTPLFQVVLVLQNTPFEDLEIDDLRLRPVSLEGATAKFDLTVNLAEHDGGLVGIVEHATDLFDASTIERLFAGFERLLAAAVAEPDQKAADLPLLSAAEKQQLLEWGGIREEFAAASTLHGRFAEQARRTPDAPALTCGDVTLTYGELHRRSNQLAHWLCGQGAGPESRVGLRLERSVDLVIGILGALKAGAAYVPIDPGSPRERTAFVVEDAEIRIVLEHLELEGLPDHDLPVGEASSLAYVIYTSGSTGRPKGTLITHANVTRLFDATEAWFEFNEKDVWTLFHSYAFDFSVWEIWGALLYGGRLVVVPWEVSRSPELFLDLLVRERVTVLNQTPSAFAQLAQADVETDLRLVIFGGEALDPAILRPWFERHGETRPRLVNMYGITETTVHVTYRPLTAADTRSVIGVPIPDLSLAVVDPSLNPAPMGVPGELVVGGAGLARGYLGRPELTAERFIPAPGGARLYRSGDLGRFLPNGEVEYLGRLDHQVKIRGFRIELGEIEAALSAHAGVRQAVVIVREGQLVAYVVGGAAVPELRQALRDRLPDYMVPAAFVTLTELPLTVNGKVDRKALPAPDQPGREEYVAPRTPVEEVLAGIWADLLGLERVGADDCFFDLGGHSLLATQVMSRLREAFGVEMPLQDLFEAPGLADLAARIEEARRTGAVPPAPPLVPVPRGGNLPLSFAQQRLWFIDRVQPGSPLYNVAAALRVEGPLDPEILARCLGEIVRRHEALRTVFAAPEGAPEQVILPPAPFELPVVDLAGLPEAEALAGEEAARPFDLARGPLLRGLLLRLGEREHVVLLTTHHIASDGWSMGLLVREITALYPAFAAGRPSPLPPLPVQYADFSVWQRSWLAGSVLEQEIAFWREQLEGLPPHLTLPTDHPRPAVLSPQGATWPVRVPAELSRQLETLGRRSGATLFMVLLAGFQALLGRLSGQDEIAVGSPVAGRNRVETEGLIGFFVNTLVLRGDLTGAPAFSELLGRVRETALAAWQHQDVPFERLVEELAPERDRSRPAIFQVVLALQNAAPDRLALPGLAIEEVPLSSGTAKFELSAVFGESEDGLAGVIEYSRDLFDAPTVGRLAGQLVQLLAAAVADPSRSLRELPLLSPGERHQLLSEWNDTRAPFPETVLLHQFFEAAVERAPEAVAAVCMGRELTYAGLEARSNQLARLLRDRGVGRGTPVGVWVERSLDMLVAVLGTLKAGGHYVALDEAWPASRVESILASTGAPAVVVGSGLLSAVEEMRWRLPALSDVVCLGVADPEPLAEPLDSGSVAELWDVVAERAVDRVTAGGFVSAFTDEPMSEAEVDEYRDRVLSLAGPRLHRGARVLEIGNGSGLLLWEMASRVAHATGIDPSPLTQERNREHAAREGIANVELRTGFAHELDALLDEDERFDLVLLASTVQFFPGPRYLERVVRQALGRLAPGGALLVADVLDARRREELREAVEEERSRRGLPAAARRQELD